MDRKLYPKKGKKQEKITAAPQVAPKIDLKQPVLQPKQKPVPLTPLAKRPPFKVPEDPLKRILFLKRTIGI